MAEAKPRLPQATLQAQRAAIVVLARQRAIKIVKRQLQARGLKPNYMPHKVIVAAAADYLRDHPELFAEAKPIVEHWYASGVFGKRAQRAWIAKLNSDAQTENGSKSTTSSVQNSSAEGSANQ